VLFDPCREANRVVAFVVHVARRIGEHQISCVAGHKLFDIRLIRRSPNQQFVAPEHPNVPQHRGRSLGEFRDRVLVRQSFGRILSREELRQFIVFERQTLYPG
jgi:hypothetical protein